MRNPSYNDIFTGIAALSDEDPAKILNINRANLHEVINGALRWAWKSYEWPNLIEIRSGTVGDRNDYLNEDLFFIATKDPRTYPTPPRLDYSLGAGGVHVFNAPPDEIDVWYVLRLPFIYRSGPAYEATVTYAKDTVVADSDFPVENYYLSLQEGNSGNPLSDAAWWRVLDIPEYLAEPVKRRAYAEWLQLKGLDEKALVARQFAEEVLLREIDVFERQRGLVRRPIYRYRRAV